MPLGIPLFRGNGRADARWLHVSIPWTRRRALQVCNLYGYDAGQEQRELKNRELHARAWETIQNLGRVPWVIGGDWNIEPAEAALPALTGGAALHPGAATTDGCSTLDWSARPRCTPMPRWLCTGRSSFASAGPRAPSLGAE